MVFEPPEIAGFVRVIYWNIPGNSSYGRRANAQRPAPCTPLFKSLNVEGCREALKLTERCDRYVERSRRLIQIWPATPPAEFGPWFFT